MTAQPTPRPFEPDNHELVWHLLTVRHLLGAPAYQRCTHGFREQTTALFRWTWGGGFTTLEPCAWVTEKTRGITRKGKNRTEGQVVVDHQRPLVLLYSDMRVLKDATPEEIYTFLAEQNILVHIHAEEDAALNKRGWRDKNRPKDAYEQLGMTVTLIPLYDRNKPIP